MNKRSLVCDTSLLLYLGRVRQVILLQELFAQIYVPEAVVLELDMGRMLRHDTLDPRKCPELEIVAVSTAMVNDLPPNRLGMGEQSAIAYALANHGHVIGLDDKQARLLAESLNLPVVGTLGIFLRAHRAGLIPSVRPLLDAVVAQGLRVTPQLYEQVLKLANEETP